MTKKCAPSKVMQRIDVFNVEKLTNCINTLLEQIVFRGNTKMFFASKMFVFETTGKHAPAFSTVLATCKRNITKSHAVDLVEVDFMSIKNLALSGMRYIMGEALVSIVKERLFFIGFGQSRPGNWRIVAMVNKSMMSMLNIIIKAPKQKTVQYRPEDERHCINTEIRKVIKIVDEMQLQPASIVDNLRSLVVHQSPEKLLLALAESRTDTSKFILKCKNVSCLTKPHKVIDNLDPKLIVRVVQLNHHETLVSVGWMTEPGEDVFTPDDHVDDVTLSDTTLITEIEDLLKNAINTFNGHYMIISPREQLNQRVRLDEEMVMAAVECAISNMKSSDVNSSFKLKNGGDAVTNANKVLTVSVLRSFPIKLASAWLVTVFMYEKDAELVRFKLRLELDELSEKKRRRPWEASY